MSQTQVCDPKSECQCNVTEHVPRFIVVTGGPGAGKTAILEVARKALCEHVAILPEAASILFGGGFWRHDTVAAKKAAQRAIFHVQREIERLVTEERKTAIALCDRGTLDGLAYWPFDESSFFEELGTSKKAELLRYRTVIHLRTPSADGGYNRSNPVRIESAREAAEIDERTIRAWEGHPNRIFIDSSEDFLTKAQRALEIIRGELPDCCKHHPMPWEDKRL